MMIVLLLLLGAFVCKGFSDDSYKEEEYGGKYHVQRRRKVVLIEFIPKDSSNVTILWKEGDKISADRKLIVTGYLSLLDLTQENSGRYVMRDKYGNEVSTHTLRVKASTNTFSRRLGGRLSFSFDLEPNSCNIYFFPERVHRSRVLKNEIVRGGRLQEGLDELDCVGFHLLKPCEISNEYLQMSCKGRYEIRDQDNNTALVVSLQMERIEWNFERKSGERFNLTSDLKPDSCNIDFFPEIDNQPGDMSIDIVREGRLQWDLDDHDCTGFNLLHPCGIENEALQMACNGRYEITDHNGDVAVVLSLEMKPIPFEPSHIGIGFGVFLTSLFCYCVRRCCCGKSSSKEETAAAAEPDVHYHEYDHEPVGPRSDQLTEPSETHYPAQPSYTPTVPLIHDHPTVDVPPPYSEVSASADAPTVPVHSDPGPQFELKGVTFPSAPPLYSDSEHCAVYTSDKLNFL
ncbi:uncharacterized protein LOC141774774 [Sebastes fasciatus]|uniref:uncharacterized protein LOC141774774 n=1 Tax=Sebastes fasciatus TaxID=394691 RepID=UPI003D9E7DD1